MPKIEVVRNIGKVQVETSIQKCERLEGGWEGLRDSTPIMALNRVVGSSHDLYRVNSATTASSGSVVA